MPVRKVSSRGGNLIGRFPSLKMRRMVAFESTLERDYLYLLDYKREVTSFEEQPLTIEYPHGGKALHYTPDFHVIRAAHHALAECKPHNLIGTEENRCKFDAARAWCSKQGWDFHVVTDRHIRVEPRLGNIKLLTRYARLVVEPDIVSRVYGCLQSTSRSLTIADVGRAIAPNSPAQVFTCLLGLAFHHQVILPLDTAPLSLNSPIGLPPAILPGGALPREGR